MRGKSLVAFALAIACGLVAMVGVQQALQKQKVDPDADKVNGVHWAYTKVVGNPLSRASEVNCTAPPCA